MAKSVQTRKIAAYVDHWDRLKQIVKTEEPIQVAEIARKCPDLEFKEVQRTIDEMVRAGALYRVLDGPIGQMRELIIYEEGNNQWTQCN